MTANEIVSVLGGVIGAASGIVALIWGFQIRRENRQKWKYEEQEKRQQAAEAEHQRDVAHQLAEAQRRETEDKITANVLARSEKQNVILQTEIETERTKYQQQLEQVRVENERSSRQQQQQIDNLRVLLDEARSEIVAIKKQYQAKIDDLQGHLEAGLAEIGMLRAEISNLKALNDQWGLDWERAMSIIRQLQTYIGVLIEQIQSLHGIPTPMPDIADLKLIQVKKNRGSWDVNQDIGRVA